MTNTGSGSGCGLPSWQGGEKSKLNRNHNRNRYHLLRNEKEGQSATTTATETILVVVGWILATAPIGVFALTLTLAAQTGMAVIGAVAGFLLVVAILLVIATLALYPLVKVLGGFPMGQFARACAPAQAVGFSTRSSLASLPPMLEEAERTLHLKPEVSNRLDGTSGIACGS